MSETVNYSMKGGSPDKGGVVVITYDGKPRAVGGRVTHAGNMTTHVFTETGTLKIPTSKWPLRWQAVRMWFERIARRVRP